MIEKHFTLDRAPGPDHAASLEPDELKQMVKSICNIEKAMGDGVKKPSKSEKNIEIARKSIVASQKLRRRFFTKDNLRSKDRFRNFANGMGSCDRTKILEGFCPTT